MANARGKRMRNGVTRKWFSKLAAEVGFPAWPALSLALGMCLFSAFGYSYVLPDVAMIDGPAGAITGLMRALCRLGAGVAVPAAVISGWIVTRRKAVQ